MRSQKPERYTRKILMRAVSFTLLDEVERNQIKTFNFVFPHTIFNNNIYLDPCKEEITL